MKQHNLDWEIVTISRNIEDFWLNCWYFPYKWSKQWNEKGKVYPPIYREKMHSIAKWIHNLSKTIAKSHLEHCDLCPLNFYSLQILQQGSHILLEIVVVSNITTQNQLLRWGLHPLINTFTSHLLSDARLFNTYQVVTSGQVSISHLTIF